MGNLLQELAAVREKMKADCHGIGEPAISIPPDKLLVTAKDGSNPKMRMCDFIELVEKTLGYMKS